MGITIKSPEEQDLMRVAGRLTADVLDMIGAHVQPGVTTDELDQICHSYIVETQKAIPAPLNYRGFPKSICTSPNHVVCHGIPGEKKLRSGDIVNIDITVIKDGFHVKVHISFRICGLLPPKINGRAISCSAGPYIKILFNGFSFVVT